MTDCKSVSDKTFGMTRGRQPMTLQEAAERLGVHYMTAYRYVRTGTLPAEKAGVHWMVDQADVDRLRTAAPKRRPRGSVRTEGPAKLAARMVDGDEAGAWTIVENALTSTLDPQDVHLDLLAPALRRIGEDWEAGRLSVADEHRATVVAGRLIGRLGPRFARRGRKRGVVVVAAPAGETHALPGAMLSDLLRGAGFEVIDLGADAPTASIVEAAEHATRLVAVLIGVTSTGHDKTVRAAITALRAAGIEVPVLVGGAAVASSEHAERLGASAWTGADGATALATIEDVITDAGAG
jgi:excisionase family DNA binding protein